MLREPAIEVENLARQFRKCPRAVDGIGLAVSPGQIYGFLGPNGAGKSTTVLMVTTLPPPTSGRATVGEFDIVREDTYVRAAIGAALQEAALPSRRRCKACLAPSGLQLHQPSLDDVFIARTGRKLEGAGDGAADEAVATGGKQTGRRNGTRRGG